MFVNKLLPATRQLFARNGLALKKSTDLARNSHVVCVPPRNRMPFSEKVVYGVLLFLSMWTAPVWILYQIPNYQKEDRHTYTGK